MQSALFRTILAALALLCTAPGSYAHSGKARFHLIIDTDGAADDLRTLCLLLGNREAEVLAVTTCEGALPPAESAARVVSLLRGFHHEGVPVGAGRAVAGPEPAWRAHSRHVDWGGSPDTAHSVPSAETLLIETLENEEEPVYYLALGALTNVADVLQRRPDLAGHFARIVWYDALPDPARGANFRADTCAARCVLASGLPLTVVAANPEAPVPITPALLDSMAAVPTVYARKIVGTHRTPPLDALVDERHLQAWDELAALYLYAPELFVTRTLGGSVEASTPASGTEAAVAAGLVAILRGKPDSESRVFYGFPVAHGLYAPDVVPIIDSAILRHGPSEWRAGVLTNELHGHLGIYATVGVKMGIRAREYFNIGVDDIAVVSFAGHRPPVSCMNDGLQVSTGGTVGHGLITVAECTPPRPEARFSFKGKTIRLALKPAYAERIRRDVRRGIERYGDLTEAYWKYVRELALRYWLDFDRHEIFDLVVEEGETGPPQAG